MFPEFPSIILFSGVGQETFINENLAGASGICIKTLLPRVSKINNQVSSNAILEAVREKLRHFAYKTI